MEQAPLYEALNIGNIPIIQEGATELTQMQQGIATYRCPSSPIPNANSKTELGSTTPAAFSTNSYVGNNGSFSASSSLSIADAGGMFWGNSRVRMRDVTDGTSNTIFAGERTWELPNTGANGKAQCDAAVVFGAGDGIAADPVSVSDLRAIFAGGFVGINDNNSNSDHSLDRCQYGFSSNHTGGAQFILVDGSVRFISENISHTAGDTTNASNTVFDNLMDRNDGEVVGEF